MKFEWTTIELENKIYQGVMIKLLTWLWDDLEMTGNPWGKDVRTTKWA